MPGRIHPRPAPTDPLEIVRGKTWYEAPPIYALRDIVTRGRDLYGDRDAVRWRIKPNAGHIFARTYDDFAADVARVQHWLGEHIPQGSRVALIGANSYMWMVTWMAVASGFGVIVPVDRLLKPQEVRPILERSQAAMFVYDASWHADVQSMRSSLPHLTHCVAMDCGTAKEEERAAIEATQSIDDRMLVLDDVIGQLVASETVPELLPAPDPDDDAAILFTSGTSAASKAVVLTNKSITADIRALLGSVSFDPPLRTLSILPLHHAFENTCGFLTVMSLGGVVHVCDGLRYIGKNLKEYSPQLTVVVPAILDAIYRRVLQEAKRSGQTKKLKFGLRWSTFLYKIGIDRRRKIMKDVLDGLGGTLRYIICGAAPVERQTLKFFRAIGVEVLAGYGLTETSPVVCGGNTVVNHFGTVGQPLSGIEMAIDNGGKRGETGEILVRSDVIMKGYLDDPVATAEAIDADGWLHTGDNGYWTRKKSLIITGRSKSMIVLSSGKKVFPEELEALLTRHDVVRDAFVFGHESHSGEIVISAKVVVDEAKLRDLVQRDPTDEDRAAALTSIIEDVNRTLPSFKGIRSYFYSLKDMVKTTTMKVRRGVELAKIEDFFDDSQISWRSLRGQNIDDIMERFANGEIPPEMLDHVSDRERIERQRERKRNQRQRERERRMQAKNRHR